MSLIIFGPITGQVGAPLNMYFAATDQGASAIVQPGFLNGEINSGLVVNDGDVFIIKYGTGAAINTGIYVVEIINGLSTLTSVSQSAAWITVSGTSVTMVPNNYYIGTNASGATYSLPTALIEVNDILQVAASQTAGPSSIAQQIGQTITLTGSTTTAGLGHGITTTTAGAMVLLIATSATAFNAYPLVGSWTTF